MSLSARPWPCDMFSLFALLLISLPLAAEVVTDGTVGPAQSLTGPDYRIGAQLGATQGGNLFHSFQRFSIETGGSATFTGPDSIRHVISRVTGGEVSNIDGLLKSEVGNADFFFINPAGIVFGPNATVDVPAAFHVGTADELRFADDSVFSATDTQASRLTVAPPEAFGYLAPQPVSLTINGSRLEFAPGQAQTLSGGDVIIQDKARIDSVDGQLQLAAVGSTVETVPLHDTSTSPGVGNGAIRIVEESILTVSGTEPISEITLRGGDIEITDATLGAQYRGAEARRGRVLLQGDTVRIVDGEIQARSYDAGDGGDILVQGKQLLFDNAYLDSGTEGPGRAGDIRLTADQIEMNRSYLYARTFERGAAGEVVITTTGNVTIHDTEIQTNTNLGFNASNLALGDAGRIRLDVARLDLTKATLDTSADSLANAGSIEIRADVMQSRQSEIKTRNMAVLNQGHSFDATSQGRAGDIVLTADEIVLDQDSTLSTYSSAGDVGRATIQADEFQLLNGSRIFGNTDGPGKGGQVDIQVADQLLIEDRDGNGLTGIETGSGLSSATVTGPAGPIDITAGSLVIGRNGWIASNTASNAPAGAITIDVNTLALQAGGEIDAGTQGLGPGADIQITAQTAVTIDGRDPTYFLDTSRIGTDTISISGRAGSITITAPELRLDQGMLDAQTLGVGQGGRIDIAVDILTIQNGGSILSGTTGPGQAGNIQIAADVVTIERHANLDTMQTQATRRTGLFSEVLKTGNAGEIRVEARERIEILAGGEISSSALRGSTGNAGRIILDTDQLHIATTAKLVNFSTIRSQVAEIASGAVGTILIDAEQINVHRGEIGIESNNAQGLTGLSGPGLIQIETGQLTLSQANINARSTGNVDAAAIRVNARDVLRLDFSQITTEANAGDGGAIEVKSDRRIHLDNSRIVTSVFGETGDGGDIVLAGEHLLLENGFIQANTAADDAAGGRIFVDTLSVIAAGGEVQIGGAVPLPWSPGRNIIQAAAPGGEQGNIDITAPNLDISGILTQVAAASAPTIPIATDPCAVADGQLVNALVLAGPEAVDLPAAGLAGTTTADADPAAAKAQLETALANGEPRAIALAYGQLGRIAQAANDLAAARHHTEQAVLAAQAAQDPALTFVWTWQWAELLSQQAQLDAATAAYRRAVTYLSAIRSDLPPTLAAGQSTYRAVVAPVYLGLADVLLRQAAQVQGQAAEQRLLRDAQAQVEQLRTAELRDYFQDACLGHRTETIATLSPHTAIIYPIQLPDRLSVLVGIGERLQQQAIAMPPWALEVNVRRLLTSLRSEGLQPFDRDLAKTVYDWLIGPFESELAAQGVDTLLFVPDGILRALPLATLWDGEGYLVERFAIATEPGLTLLDPRPLPERSPNALLAGLSEPGPVVDELPQTMRLSLLERGVAARERGLRGASLHVNELAESPRALALVSGPPAPASPAELALLQPALALPGVEKEIDQLTRTLPEHEVLFNETFRLQTFTETVQTRPYDILHIASHGYFGGAPEQNFIMTYDRKLDMTQLGELLKSKRLAARPVELLTLSACQTAEGDDRAPLGLSGVALQAGARTAIGSLWPVSDAAAQALIPTLYERLGQDGLNKAQALQAAQRELLAQERFRHPFYWSPFILIGNWL